jgi:hypothetical protein
MQFLTGGCQKQHPEANIFNSPRSRIISFINAI